MRRAGGVRAGLRRAGCRLGWSTPGWTWDWSARARIGPSSCPWCALVTGLRRAPASERLVAFRCAPAQLVAASPDPGCPASQRPAGTHPHTALLLRGTVRLLAFGLLSIIRAISLLAAGIFDERKSAASQRVCPTGWETQPTLPRCWRSACNYCGVSCTATVDQARRPDARQFVSTHRPPHRPRARDAEHQPSRQALLIQHAVGISWGGNAGARAAGAMRWRSSSRFSLRAAVADAYIRIRTKVRRQRSGGGERVRCDRQAGGRRGRAPGGHGTCQRRGRSY